MKINGNQLKMHGNPCKVHGNTCIIANFRTIRLEARGLEASRLRCFEPDGAKIRNFACISMHFAWISMHFQLISIDFHWFPNLFWCFCVVWVATPGDFENLSLLVIFVGGCPRWFLIFIVFSLLFLACLGGYLRWFWKHVIICDICGWLPPEISDFPCFGDRSLRTMSR